MAGFTTLLAVYVFGGVTFVPLLVISVFLAGLYTFPYRPNLDDASEAPRDDLVQPGDDVTALEAALKAEKKDKEKTRSHHESDEAAGYFAVCREYTPMGINAKPIERTTPAGSTPVAAPSQSIYQTMYRGIFERKQAPSLNDNNSGNTSVSQRPKKAGNVYYVILRHGHLMLFDDEDQAEVRYVISLLLHDITIYSGGEAIPEGELFIKRNAICLSRKHNPQDGPDTRRSKPFYLFCESCSAKEDFYFALLKNQDQVLGAETKTPRPLHFDTKHIIDLVQKLYATEDNTETRWLNALLGRIFLGIYRTQDIQHFIREKITKKISRIKRPSFLTHITVRRIDLGDSAPFITNPRLRDLNVQGECVLEADVKYTGSFRIEIGTTAKVDIGSFNREVTLVLAVVLRKLEGHALVKIKAPPTDRLWVSFTSMPKMEMTIEPIVSSRQITWNIILNQIESRIREVFAESMVLPFWDDTPFFRTEHKKWRGGIWQDDDAVRPPSDIEAAVAQGGNVDEVEKFEQGDTSAAGKAARSDDKSHSLPNIDVSSTEKSPAPSPSPGLFSRRLTGKGFLSKANATTTGAEPKSPAHSSRAPRTGSFSSTPIPIVGTDTTNSEVFKPSTPPDVATAASRIATLSGRVQHEQETTADLDAQGVCPSPSGAASTRKPSSIRSVSSTEAPRLDDTSHAGPPRADTMLSTATTGTTSSTDSTNPTSPASGKFSIRSHPTASSLARGLFNRKDDSQTSIASGGSGTSATTTGAGTGDTKRGAALQAVSNAAFQARQWGLNALKRNDSKGQEGEVAAHHHVDLSQPMGRGQPLPPPGVPLPMPDRKTPTAPVPPQRRNLAPPPIIPGNEHGHIPHHNEDVTESPGRQMGASQPFKTSHGHETELENRSSHDNHHGDNKHARKPSVGSSNERKMSRRPVPAPPLPRRRLNSRGDMEFTHDIQGGRQGDQEEDEMLVVAAPESSEPTTPMTPEHPVGEAVGGLQGKLAGPGASPRLGTGTESSGVRVPVPVPQTGSSPSGSGLGIEVYTPRTSAPELTQHSHIPERSFSVASPRSSAPELPPRPRVSSQAGFDIGLIARAKPRDVPSSPEGEVRSKADSKVDHTEGKAALAQEEDDFSGWMDDQEFEGLDVVGEPVPAPATAPPLPQRHHPPAEEEGSTVIDAPPRAHLEDSPRKHDRESSARASEDVGWDGSPMPSSGSLTPSKGKSQSNTGTAAMMAAKKAYTTTTSPSNSSI